MPIQTGGDELVKVRTQFLSMGIHDDSQTRQPKMRNQKHDALQTIQPYYCSYQKSMIDGF